MVYFSLTAKFEWLTLVRPAATARAHSRSRNAFGEETLTSCLTRVGGPEIGRGVRQLIHLDIPETEAKEDEEIRIGFTIRGFFTPEPMTGHIRRSVKASGSRKYYWTLRE